MAGTSEFFGGNTEGISSRDLRGNETLFEIAFLDEMKPCAEIGDMFQDRYVRVASRERVRSTDQRICHPIYILFIVATSRRKWSGGHYQE